MDRFSEVTIDLRGVGRISEPDAAEIRVFTGLRDFGSVATGASESVTVSVTNVGTSLLTASASVIESSVFSVSPTLFTLEPGETGLLDVTFSPSTAGAWTGELNITINDGVTPSVKIPMIGAATELPQTLAFTFDLDEAEGDQGATRGDASGQTVLVQVFADGILGANGVTFSFGFDPNRVGIESFSEGDVLPEPAALYRQADPTTVDVTVASLGGRATNALGLVGTAMFQLLDGVSPVVIDLLRATVRRDGAFERYGGLSAQVSVMSGGEKSSDFNGDGEVGFSDFLLFAVAFGTSADLDRFDAKFDLDSSGDVGFGDFLLFAGQFGT